MVGESNYNGKKDYVVCIDDIGQIHGTWGGCALIPDKDKFEVIECCGICGEEISGFGNNPNLIKCDRVCDNCNMSVVLPLRIFFSGYCDNQIMIVKTNNEVEFVDLDKENTLKQLQDLVGGLVEIYPKEDDEYYYIVDEEGLLKEKEFNKEAQLAFDILCVGDVVIIKKEYFE